MNMLTLRYDEIEILGGVLLMLEMWAALRSKSSEKGRARDVDLGIIIQSGNASWAASERNFFSIACPNSRCKRLEEGGDREVKTFSVR